MSEELMDTQDIREQKMSHRWYDVLCGSVVDPEGRGRGEMLDRRDK